MNDPRDAGTPGLGNDMRDTRDVDLGEFLPALGRDRDRVDDGVDPVEGTAERLRLAHVGAAYLQASSVRVGKLNLGSGPFADERPNVVPPLEELWDHVPAHEPVRA